MRSMYWLHDASIQAPAIKAELYKSLHNFLQWPRVESANWNNIDYEVEFSHMNPTVFNEHNAFQKRGRNVTNILRMMTKTVAIWKVDKLPLLWGASKQPLRIIWSESCAEFVNTITCSLSKICSVQFHSYSATIHIKCGWRHHSTIRDPRYSEESEPQIPHEIR